jgi:hypothetical protein
MLCDLRQLSGLLQGEKGKNMKESVVGFLGQYQNYDTITCES